jgi:hypothetical protein
MQRSPNWGQGCDCLGEKCKKMNVCPTSHTVWLAIESILFEVSHLARVSSERAGRCQCKGKCRAD